MSNVPADTKGTIDLRLEGKTYSLHGPEQNSDRWYALIAALTDTLLSRGDDPRTLLQRIRRISRSKRRLKSWLRPCQSETPEGRVLQALRPALQDYTRSTPGHLNGLRGFKRFDATLSATEEQYHLFMVEIELVNRLCARNFRHAKKRLAFLPHCLRDLAADCRSVDHGLDRVCRACSAGCTINAVSRLLRRNRITPYIWLSADLRGLLRRVRGGGELGVLGIACIPELVNGMRMCMRYDVPVVGIPLDANRCARWWGEFRWNTVNMQALARLIGAPPTAT